MVMALGSTLSYFEIVFLICDRLFQVFLHWQRTFQILVNGLYSEYCYGLQSWTRLCGDLNCQFWTYFFILFTIDINFSWNNEVSIKGCGEKYYVVKWR